MSLPTKEEWEALGFLVHPDLCAKSLINGNLKDARRMAKGFSGFRLIEALREAGHSEHRAFLGAAWLKGAPCWQEYCDAQ